jgi:HlyD family secretion protein
MRKIWIYLPVSVVIIIILWQAFFKKRDSRIELISEPISRGQVADVISATGTLKALNTVDVGTQVSGVIDEIYTDYNKPVKKGQLLSKLDTRTLVANVADANAALQKAKLQSSQAATVYERSKKLFEQNLVSQEEFDRTKFEFESAQLNVETAKTALERAQVNLGYATIVSPVEGIVISKNIEKGQTVAAAFTTPVLFTIAADLKEMIIEADIDEADIGKVKVDQDAEFFVDAFPNEYFKGKVKQIRLQPKTIQNVVNYTVVISVANPDMKLFPGMTANLVIVAQKRTNVLLVPGSALNYSLPNELPSGYKLFDTTGYDENEISNRARIWILKKDRSIHARIVETGVSDGAISEITKGASENEIIITGVLEGDDNVKKKKTSPFMPNVRKPEKKDK